MTYLITTLCAHWDEWYSALSENEKKIYNTAALLKISAATAAKQHPFDPRNLAMFTYGTMLKVFETVLGMTNWPMGNKAIDYLLQKHTRKLEVILDHSKDIDPAKANSEETLCGVSTSRLMKKLKTSQRLKDDTKYRPSSGSTSAIPITLRSQELTRIKEMPVKVYNKPGSDVENEQNSDAK